MAVRDYSKFRSDKAKQVTKVSKEIDRAEKTFLDLRARVQFLNKDLQPLHKQVYKDQTSVLFDLYTTFDGIAEEIVKIQKPDGKKLIQLSKEDEKKVKGMDRAAMSVIKQIQKSNEDLYAVFNTHLKMSEIVQKIKPK